MKATEYQETIVLIVKIIVVLLIILANTNILHKYNRTKKIVHATLLVITVSLSIILFTIFI